MPTKSCELSNRYIYTMCTCFHHPSHQIPSQTLMCSLTPAQHHHILELLDKGLSGHAIAKTTGISVSSISTLHSKHCSSLSKSLGCHPQKLSPADTHAVHLITSQQAENATDVAKTLQDMTNISFPVKTVRRALRGTGMKAMTKQK